MRCRKSCLAFRTDGELRGKIPPSAEVPGANGAETGNPADLQRTCSNWMSLAVNICNCEIIFKNIIQNYTNVQLQSIITSKGTIYLCLGG